MWSIVLDYCCSVYCKYLTVDTALLIHPKQVKTVWNVPKISLTPDSRRRATFTETVFSCRPLSRADLGACEILPKQIQCFAVSFISNFLLYFLFIMKRLQARSQGICSKHFKLHIYNQSRIGGNRRNICSELQHEALLDPKQLEFKSAKTWTLSLWSFSSIFILFLKHVSGNNQLSAPKIMCFPPVSVSSLCTVWAEKLSERCGTILFHQHSNQCHSPSDTHSLTHTALWASWRQTRASIKPAWVWEPFRGHFAPDLQSSILLTTAPWWPSAWPCGGRDRWRDEDGAEEMMEKLWIKLKSEKQEEAEGRLLGENQSVKGKKVTEKEIKWRQKLINPVSKIKLKTVLYLEIQNVIIRFLK